MDLAILFTTERGETSNHLSILQENYYDKKNFHRGQRKDSVEHEIYLLNSYSQKTTAKTKENVLQLYFYPFVSFSLCKQPKRYNRKKPTSTKILCNFEYGMLPTTVSTPHKNFWFKTLLFKKSEKREVCRSH